MSKKTLSAKQKSALSKGHNLMKKAVAAQKKAGTKTVTVYSGGHAQKLDVYKLNLKDALKRAR
jgi:endonuclease IV